VVDHLRDWRADGDEARPVDSDAHARIMPAAADACSGYPSPMPTRSRTATVGQPAPDFGLTDQHGNEFRLDEAVAAGPVVLVFLRGFS
jgi:hypothetical protein